jgi:hypothetical protein
VVVALNADFLNLDIITTIIATATPSAASFRNPEARSQPDEFS